MLLELFGGFVLADVAPDPITGGVTIMPQQDKETDIALIREEVFIDVWKESIKVKAIFALQNTGGDKKLVVGFPYSYVDELMNFRANIQGLDLLVRDDAVTTADESIQDKKYTTYWKTWDMVFPKDSTQIVQIDYFSVPPSYSAQNYQMTTTEFSSWYAGSEKEDIENKLKQFEVSYVLTTGAAWKGGIGQAHIRLILHDLGTDQIEEFSPQNGVTVRDGIDWVFENFEPNENIYVSILPNIKKHESIPFFVATFNKHPEDSFVAEGLGRLYIKNGEVSKAMDIYSRFLLPANQVPKLWTEDASNFESARAACIWRMCNFVMDHLPANPSISERKSYAQKALPIYQKFLEEITRNQRTWGAKENTIKNLEQYIQRCHDLLNY